MPGLKHREIRFEQVIRTVCDVMKADNDDNVLFKFTLNNFSNFKNNPKYVSSSNEFAIGNLKWYLKIDNETDGYIACFLYCLSNKLVLEYSFAF